MTYLVNLSEKDYVRKKNKWCVPTSSLPSSSLLTQRAVCIMVNRLSKIKAWIDEHNPGDPLIPFSVALEERLVVMSPEEKKEEEQKIGATSALGKITQAGYSSLDVRCCPLFRSLAVSASWEMALAVIFQLIRYFTCGPDEVRAWTIRKGTKAPQAAGVIQYVPSYWVSRFWGELIWLV